MAEETLGEVGSTNQGKFYMVVALVVVALVAVLTVVLSRPSKAEIAAKQRAAAVDKALVYYQQLRNDDLNGDAASEKVQEISQTLANFGGVAAIKLGQDDLMSIVQNRYAADARKKLTECRGIRNSENNAKACKAQFLALAGKAGKNPPELQTNEEELNRIVSLNYLQGAQAQHVTITPAMYRAAGIPVPRVVHTRTRIVRVPSRSTKPSVKKVTAKPKSTRRRSTTRPT